MKTVKDINDSKARMIKQGRDMQQLTQHEGFKLLMKRLQELSDTAKEEIVSSETWEDFLKKKAYLSGLLALSREVDTIISRGKSQERNLKI